VEHVDFYRELTVWTGREISDLAHKRERGFAQNVLTPANQLRLMESTAAACR
jgi:hypothetical protein